MEEFVHELGPEKIVFVHEKKSGMKGVLVIDNTARGVGKGGIRYTPDVTVGEVVHLAKTMSLKNSIVDLPLGGAKSGIIGNPKAPNKEQVVRAYARAIEEYLGNNYVGAPDMNMGMKDMAWIADETCMEGVTGKPEEIGGIPHEWGTTGYGVGIATMIALKHSELDVDKGVHCAIEGFGNVGVFAMKTLTERGVKVVAVSDSKGMVYDPDGLDYEKLLATKMAKGTVAEHKEGKVMATKDLFSLPVDVLIPGTRVNIINEKNYKEIKAKIIVEAANHPMPHEIETELSKSGKLVVPDIVANAGGVITSYMEMLGNRNRKAVFEEVERRISTNLEELFKYYSAGEKINLRDKGTEIASDRIKKAMELRGWIHGVD